MGSPGAVPECSRDTKDHALRLYLRRSLDINGYIFAYPEYESAWVFQSPLDIRHVEMSNNRYCIRIRPDVHSQLQRMILPMQIKYSINCQRLGLVRLKGSI